MRKFLSNFSVCFLLLWFCFSSPLHAQLVDNGDGTVTDTESGLMWLQESLPATGSTEIKTWKQAMLWANSLNFAGHDDWRLPSALHITSGTPDLLWNSYNNEWGNLYGHVWSNPAYYPADIVPMNNYPAGVYWTSTEHPANSGQAVAFYISYDNVWLNQFHAKTMEMRITAVRGAPKPVIAPECNDGYDNDGNGLTDFPEDEGCSSAEDAGEFSCVGIWGWINCGPRLSNSRNICFQIDDSTICLDLIMTIIGVIVLPLSGWWWWRRREDD